MVDLVTAEDLAKALKVRKATICTWVSRREMPFVKRPGNVTRFPKKAIEQWWEKRYCKGKTLPKHLYLNP